MDQQAKDVFEPSSTTYERQRATLIEWINSTLSNVTLPTNASDNELRQFLINGSVLCRILNKLRPGSVESSGSDDTSDSGLEKVKRFLAAIDKMGLPKFQIHDLEKGSIKIVVECLLTLRAQYVANVGGNDLPSIVSPSASGSSFSWKQLVNHYRCGDASPRGEISRAYSSTVLGEEKRKNVSDSKFQHALPNPIMSESSTALLNHAGYKFHEVFQLKHGGYADLPPAKLSEMMKSNSLDSAPTQSLLSVVNGILDESVERKNGEIPYRVACLLRKVVQEIERRISTQAEHLRTQNNLFRAREEKYQSRIRVLEALASATSEDAQIVMNQLCQVKGRGEEIKKLKELAVDKLIKQTDNNHREIASLKQELQIAKKSYEQLLQQISTETKGTQEIMSLKQELDASKKNYESLYEQINSEAKRHHEIESLKQELERYKKNHEELLLQMDAKAKGAREILTSNEELKLAKSNYEQRCLQIETEAKRVQKELEERLKEAVHQLTDSRNRVKELEAYSDCKTRQWNKKELIYQKFTKIQLEALKELKISSQAIKQEVSKTKESYVEEFNRLGAKIEELENAAENYYAVLAENRKLHNEVQDLKGNIRVYCRIRPFLPRQTGKQSIVHHISENGEIIVVNPSKQGKESQRSFKFNKVYGPAATQVEVYSDTRPLIQSVLDGYNVCIFAYGQTGSGKTYTMTGPDGASEEDWGVNYRALNDLFHISQKRGHTYTYEIAVQMVEIYNEQVRDLLASGGSQKRLGIWTASQPSGLAVPDASMYPVQSTSDVLELMEIGLKNRAKGFTSMNERSSRSHSVLTIHARGKDLSYGPFLCGSLHLVDLAGSERVDRSEVTGDRLKEAQHINKSLSALGDVIFALSQKSSHVPYRNSKLTQVLQSSLGGQAKTLMFVQLNPDVGSFSESVSTLKFAERVSGVELGTARSNKEGRDVRELMEQVLSLKDTIAKKEEEIEQLQLLKDLRNANHGINGEKGTKPSTRYATPQRSLKVSSLKSSRAASEQDSCSDKSAKKSSISSQKSTDGSKHQNGSLQHSKSVGANLGQKLSADTESLRFSDGEYEERSSDISDSVHSLGTDTDCSVESNSSKPSEKTIRAKSTVKIPRPLQTAVKPSNDVTAKMSPGIIKSSSGNSLSSKSTKRWH